MSNFTTSLTLDASRFNRALTAFARYSRKGGQEILLDQARNFVRRVVALTPPARGKANADARRRGEATITADLARIFSPGSSDFIERFIAFNGGSRELKEDFGHRNAAALGFIYTRALERREMAQWHWSRRRKDGRVTTIGGGAGLNREAAARITTGLRKRDLRALDVGLVEKGAYAWFRKSVQGRVGLLASGWNRAAETLGYTPPQWIRRHGTSRGSIDITTANGAFRVRVTNDVKFAGSVKDLSRRVQSALNQQAQAMEKRVKFFEEKAAKRAGFK
jgi:hypothetical protein